MRRKVLNQQQAYRLIREHIEIKIEEQQIKEGQAAFRRSILQHLAEEMRGEPTDLSTLDEGLLGNLFDKAKSFIGGSEKQQGALTRAVEKATDSKTQEFFQKLQKVSPGFPNTKGTDKFIAGLALLKATYQTLAQLAQNAESQVQRITAAAAASDIAAYAQDAVGDMSRTFKYFKEGEEEDLAEVDVRTPFGVGNKAKRALDKIIAQVKDGKGYDLADRDALQKHGQKLAAKIAGKGKVGKGSKFQDQTLTRIQDFLNPPADAKPNDPIVKAGRDITNSWRDSSNPGENPLKSLGVKDLNAPGDEDPELRSTRPAGRAIQTPIRTPTRAQNPMIRKMILNQVIETKTKPQMKLSRSQIPTRAYQILMVMHTHSQILRSLATILELLLWIPAKSAPKPLQQQAKKPQVEPPQPAEE